MSDWTPYDDDIRDISTPSPSTEDQIGWAAKLQRGGYLAAHAEPEWQAVLEGLRLAIETLTAFIPYPDDLTKCIKACVESGDSRQTRIHAAYWVLKPALAAYKEKYGPQ